MPNADNKKIEDLLKEIFENVNNWLHFAEAKNAALIAFNIAILSALFSNNLFSNHFFLFTITCVCFLVSTAISLTSFTPTLTEISKNVNEMVEKNLLFYAYIASFDPMEYAKQIYLTYFDYSGEGSINIEPLCLDYAKEIVSNSRITVRKLKKFSSALFIDIIALLLCIIIVIHS